jgi:hypothetical protein
MREVLGCSQLMWLDTLYLVGRAYIYWGFQFGAAQLSQNCADVLHPLADLQAADITKACSAMGGEPHIPRRLEEARKVPEAHNEAFAAGAFSA